MYVSITIIIVTFLIMLFDDHNYNCHNYTRRCGSCVYRIQTWNRNGTILYYNSNVSLIIFIIIMHIQRPGSKAGGVLTMGGSLNSQITIPDRPVTQQGLSGIKTGVKGNVIIITEHQHNEPQGTFKIRTPL